jgi:hypothetical protein
LKFCLQDGAALGESTEHKTEVFDHELFAEHETVAIGSESTNPVVRPGDTDSNSAGTVPDDSTETVMRPLNPTDKADKSGFSGFFYGCLAAFLMVGVLGAIALGIWFVPSLIQDPANTNSGNSAGNTSEVSLDEILNIRASSLRKAESGNLYIAQNVFDRDDRTAWCEGVSGPGKGEWIRIEFDKPLKLSEMTIKPGYFKNASVWKKNNRLASIRLQFSGGESRTFEMKDEMKSQKIPLSAGKTKFVKIFIEDYFEGSSDQKDTLISEVGFSAVR